MSLPPVIKRLKGGRIECTITFDEADTAPAEAKALHELSRNIELPGFRKGSAPVHMMREKIHPQKLFEETVHHLLPSVFESLIKEQDIKPVIQPRVEAQSREPLTLKIIFVEKPEVTLKGIKKITIEKKEPALTDDDVEKMVEYILEKHTSFRTVDRAAHSGDRITMDFHGTDASGKEIDGIRTKGHAVKIGSKVLIPGFEDALIGMKNGESTDFTLTFPAKYHAEQLQGKPVTFHVTVTKIEEVLRPELTDTFVQKELNAASEQEFRTQIRESMLRQEQAMEHQRQERALLEKIADCTTVELAPELIDEERQQIIGEFTKQLRHQELSVEQWLQKTKKPPEDFMKEMAEQATKRLTLRLGIQKLVEEKSIDVTDAEMDQIVEGFLAKADAGQRKEVAPAYQKGAQAYEQLKWQTKVERALATLL